MTKEGVVIGNTLTWDMVAAASSTAAAAAKQLSWPSQGQSLNCWKKRREKKKDLRETFSSGKEDRDGRTDRQLLGHGKWSESVG